MSQVQGSPGGAGDPQSRGEDLEKVVTNRGALSAKATFGSSSRQSLPEQHRGERGPRPGLRLATRLSAQGKSGEERCRALAAVKRSPTQRTTARE